MSTGVPVFVTHEVSPLKEGGGRIDLPRADQPLLFTDPTAVSFGLRRPGTTAARTLTLSDAGGGAGVWSVSVVGGAGALSAPAQTSVPGTLQVRLAIGKLAQQDVSGFVVLTRAGVTRRVPFWFRVERPQLSRERQLALPRPGTYRGDTSRGVARVSTYRYPEVPPGQLSLPVVLPGPEVVYRVHIRRRVANFGVAIVSRSRGVSVEPRIVRSADENRLAGLTAFPYDANPYRSSEGHHRLIVGVLQPSPGAYAVVFDSPARGRTGRFVFRLWQDDTTPPGIRVLGVRGRVLELRVADRGSGVDPASLVARVDGSERSLSYVSGVARISLTGVARGRHTLVFSAADYQEAKNNENVRGILPNTRSVKRAFTVR
jgi:hypothetical protein